MSIPPAEDPLIPQSSTAPVVVEQGGSRTQEYKILTELIEDVEVKKKVMLKMQAIEEIRQAPPEQRQQKINLWAARLEKHPRTITRMLARVEREGLASLARTVRSDSGKLRGSKRWREKDLAFWTTFIEDTYKDGNKHSRRMTPNQAYLQVKGHAELKLGLQEGEYPSHVFVYKVLEPLIEKKNRKVRNPGQSNLIIKTTEGDLLVERSNQVWQIDHTKLDLLLVDSNGDSIGCIFITAIIDSYSGCVVGFHLGFEAAGSHEVALALRHAFLPKHYGAEYKLQKEWGISGIPEFIVTDHAKEFKSGHLRHVGLDLGFNMRLRLYTEQGGLIESLFDKENKEIFSLLPGYKGSNIAKRPEDAEKYACITYEELERILVRYFVDHYNQHLYPRVKIQTRLQRWQSGLIGEPRQRDERELDICLMKTTPRKVQEYGSVLFECLIYRADWLQAYESQSITLRYNPSNIVTLMVYTVEQDEQPSKYLGTVTARDIDAERLSLKEWQQSKRKIRAEGKAVDQSSILSERMDLNEFAQEKIRTLKQRRRAEQGRMTAVSNRSKVVEMKLRTSASGQETVESRVSLSDAESADVGQSTPVARLAKAVVRDWSEYLEENW
jgi:putative transposase